MFIELLSTCTIVSFGNSLASNFEGCLKCVSTQNLPCHTGPTLVDINSNRNLFIYLLLVLISLVKFIILLMIHMFKYVFNMK